MPEEKMVSESLDQEDSSGDSVIMRMGNARCVWGSEGSGGYAVIMRRENAR